MEKDYIMPSHDIYDDDDQSDSDDVTYEDICSAVKLNVNLEEIKDMLDKYDFDHQLSKDHIDIMIDELWNNVIKPYIHETTVILNNDTHKIQREFCRWLYDNSNLGRKITYIDALRGVIDAHLNGPIGTEGPGDDIVAGDEGQ